MDTNITIMNEQKLVAEHETLLQAVAYNQSVLKEQNATYYAQDKQIQSQKKQIEELTQVLDILKGQVAYYQGMIDAFHLLMKPANE